MSTNFGQYDFLQILHQNQLTSQQKISALFQVEDLYQRRMYGLYKIQQKNHTAAHQIYNKNARKY